MGKLANLGFKFNELPKSLGTKTLKLIAELSREYNDQALILACSGGADSMLCLKLLLLAELKPIVVHVNYGLRGAESDRDEDIVTRFCLENGLTVEVHNVQQTITGNIQTQARKIRYDFFDTIKAKHPNSLLVTAHNTNDHLETLLLNLSRGSGARGLRGLIGSRNLRPLIHFTKEEVYRLCEALEVPYGEDSSNQSLKYERNKIRRLVIPELEKIHGDVLHKSVEASERLNSALQVAERTAREWLSLNSRQPYEGVTEYRNLNTLPESELPFYIESLSKGHFLSYEDFTELCTAIKTGATCKKECFDKETQSSVWFSNYRKALYKITPAPYPCETMTLSPDVRDYAFGRVKLRLSELEDCNTEALKPHSYIISESLLQEGLMIRGLQAGDKIDLKPGLSKKLSDAMNEAGLPSLIKAEVPVVCSSTGKILALYTEAKWLIAKQEALQGRCFALSAIK